MFKYVFISFFTENLGQHFFKFFLGTTFVHDSCYPDHYEPKLKIFFRFSKSWPSLRYTILDSRVALCNAISESRPPLRNTIALPSELRIENDSDRKFFKYMSQSFSGNYFWFYIWGSKKSLANIYLRTSESYIYTMQYMLKANDLLKYWPA